MDNATLSRRVRTPLPPLRPLIASADGPFPSSKEAFHGTGCESAEVGRLATTIGAL